MNKYIYAAIMMLSISASANEFDSRKQAVANFVADLPAASSLQGDEGCEEISFVKDVKSGIYGVQFGNAAKIPWLGLDGEVEMTNDSLAQDFTGGGVDSGTYRFQVAIIKSQGRLVAAKYRYYSVKGLLFQKKTLLKSLDCSAK
jgi:hypothetical protein